MRRILIISGGLQIGGAERVAANISRYAPKDEFVFDYIVFEGIENVYGAEIESDGGRVITLPSPAKGYLKYIRTLRTLIAENKYVAVHSHTMFNSGINLAVAKLCGVPCRVAHSHTTKTEIRTSATQKIYESFMRALIRVSATKLLACGVAAGEWMFGKRTFTRKGAVVLNGIDTKAFTFSGELRKKIRSSLKWESDYIIGHAGSIIPLKNQAFLIKLMPQIIKKNPNARLVLLGSGDEENETTLNECIKKSAAKERITMCGAVMNVNEYLNAFDVFVFPSLREGTPLALLEAQTNGLPCVMSERVPDDAIVTDLVRKATLGNETEWIDAILDSRRTDPEEYAGIMEQKGYDSERSYAIIYDLYRRAGIRK